MKTTLGETLVKQGLLTEDELATATKTQQKTSTKLGQILKTQGLISETKFIGILAKEYGYEHRAKLDFKYDETFAQVPLEFIHKVRMVPLSRKEDTITVAMLNPEETHLMDDFRVLLQPCQVEFIISTEGEIMRIIHGSFDRARAIAKEVMGGTNKEQYSEFENLSEDTLDLANEAPIIRMVNAILTQAVEERASDIHISVSEKSLEVQYRIDGVLHSRLTPPKVTHAGLISRVKIMANLNIAENRLPQDGRIKIKLAGKEVDVRVSTVPTQYGERVVMRLLNKTDVHYTLDSLGLYSSISKRIKTLVQEPNGIILVTGPTGSGKSTTLYAILSHINDGVKNILTAEDPIEYEIPGISQMQMQEKIGFTFAQALRAMLRQDPDVIMVGEIRDEETARIAIQSSLTGHLVFSTLHTNDAPSAVTRLIDMGIEPYLITSTVRAVLAQRLVRTICPNCKYEFKPKPEELRELGLSQKALNGKRLSHGRGCSVCVNTGYHGRTGIYSLMELSSVVQQAVLKSEDADTIAKKAKESLHHPMNTLLEYGQSKVLDGVTTIEEVMRVT